MMLNTVATFPKVPSRASNRQGTAMPLHFQADKPKTPDPSKNTVLSRRRWLVRAGAMFTALLGTAGFGANALKPPEQGEKRVEPPVVTSTPSEPDKAIPLPLKTENGLLTTYPPYEAFNKFMLEVSPIHKIYVEESGNPNGVPVFYLHGGPGAGIGPEHREWFDPKFFHVIGFDQRGCEKSTPLGEVKENTTWDLVGDIEKIRDHLKIKGKALIFGGSWGSLLALAYAEAHPEHVAGLITRGISLGEPEQTAWSTVPGTGVFNLYPEASDLFMTPIKDMPLSEADKKQNRNPYLGAYYKLFTDPNIPEKQRLDAVRYWEMTEDIMSGEDPATLEPMTDQECRDAFPSVLMVCHYYYFNAFLEPQQLLKNINKLKDIPYISIVNGRKDLHTPPIRAHLLQKALTKAGIKSKLRIVKDAGHSAWNPNNAHELMTSLNEFKDLVSTNPDAPKPDAEEKVGG